MNPALLLTVGSITKKHVVLVLATMTVIVALPVMAVFSLGTGALSFLSGSSGGQVSDAVSTTSQGVYEGPEVPGDTYAWGNCTYWAFALRAKNGNPIPITWGNANTWDDRAAADGYLVDHLPSIGAVFQTDRGSLGHVAYVAAVDPITGNWTISEMNSIGLNIVDLKVYTAASANQFNFIHDKVANAKL